MKQTLRQVKSPAKTGKISKKVAKAAVRKVRGKTGYQPESEQEKRDRLCEENQD